MVIRVLRSANMSSPSLFAFALRSTLVPSDDVAFDYFEKLRNKGNIYSIRAIACFLGAAHEIMLESLQDIEKQEGPDGKKVLASWHNHMEYEDHRHITPLPQ
jgi:hypothetical protein